MENGLKDLSRETGFYEPGPLRGQAHSFSNSGREWNIVPLPETAGPSWAESRRDIKSENQTYYIYILNDF